MTVLSLVATPYKYYRFVFAGSFAPTNNYASFAEVKLYDGVEGTGVDLTAGAIATSKGQYGSGTGAANVVDGNTATYYESESANFAGGGTTWLKLELANAAVARSIKVTPSSYTNEYPVIFHIEGSNDNVEWAKLFESKALPVSGPVEYTRTISTYVGGLSRLEDGRPGNRVLIHNWATGALLGATVPDAVGNWFYSVDYGTEVLVTHIGPSGYEPKSDGPITPFYW